VVARWLPIDRRLPREVHLLQSGLVVNALGNGAANPFVVVYLHQVRGIPLGLAGLAAGTGACAALLGTLWGGSLADRIGSRRTVVFGLACSAAAFALYPLLREARQAFALALLGGIGGGIWISGQGALLAKVTPPELRHAAFAQQRVAANLGLGLGGLLGGVVAASGAWTALFAANALTFLAYAAVVLRLPEAAPTRRAGGYGVVARDALLARLVLVNAAYVAAAISLLSAIAPVFATTIVGVGEGAVGLLFLLNTMTIVSLQMPIARLQEGRRRARSLSLIGVVFAASWLVLSEAEGFVLLAVAFVLFALGECVYDSVYGPLVAAIAPEGLVGRYLAASGLSWQLGFVAGPAIGGAALAWSAGTFWVGTALVCLAAAALALTLDARLPAAARRTPQPAGPRQVPRPTAGR
jgi:MFS family permease